MRADQSDFISPSQLDFVPRDRRNESFKLIMAFVLIMALVFVTGYAPPGHSHAYGPLIAIVGLGILCFFVVLHHQRALDLVMHTEYQSLLFSQALRLGSTFCIFVRRDGAIVYANEGLRDIFGPNDYSQTSALDAILSRGGVGRAERERIFGAIYNNVSDRIVFPLTMPDGSKKNYILTLEPFVRPAGYVLIRGREYFGERSGTQIMPDMLRSTTPHKLDHLLGHTPIAHYATDAFGRFEYVNQAFETCLDFEAGEVVDRRLNIKQVLYKLGEHAVSSDYLIGDYVGDAQVQRKGGELMDCLVFQRLIRDERGKPTGATGSIVAATALK